MTAAVAATADVAVLATADDYLGLTAEQRYNVVSQHFPSWLLTEPIEFPAHHSTYGWACRVDGCDGCCRPRTLGCCATGTPRSFTVPTIRPAWMNSSGTPIRGVLAASGGR